MIDIFFYVWIIGFIISLISTTKKDIRLDFLGIIQTFILIGIILPLYEESIFRFVLPHFFGHYEYFKIVNALLFGLFHTLNLLYNNVSIKSIVHQVIMTTFLGYYLINLDDFMMCCIFHSMYNIINISITLIIIKIKVYFGIIKSCNTNISSHNYIFVDKLRKSKSQNNLIRNYDQRHKIEKSNIHKVKKNSLPEELQILFTKMDEIKNKMNNEDLKLKRIY